ncbi:MAG: peptidylprolyl isomerase [bacterium]|nr:peptidylprolyl isomerase [bacterium]
MLSKKISLFISFILFFQLGFTQVKSKVKEKPVADCRQVIGELQDRRNTVLILNYFTFKNEGCRAKAVQAFGTVQDTFALPALIQILNADQSVVVRNMAAYSLGQYRLDRLCSILISAYTKEKETIVKRTLLESIGKCATTEALTFYETVNLVFTDSEIGGGYSRGVFFAARRNLKSNLIHQKVSQLAFATKDPFILYVENYLNRIKIKLPAPLPLSKLPIDDKACFDSLKQYKDAYQKVKWLEKYQVSKVVYDSLAFTNEGHFLTSYCVEQSIATMPFDAAFVKRCLESKNLAFIAMAVEKIRKDSLWVANGVDVAYLKKLQSGIIMPQDYEAWVEIEKAICQLELRDYQYKVPLFNHPIDWKYANKLKALEKVKITTTKGIMVLSCYVNEAPGSVVNFLKLVDQGFYNQKYFHRMVPEFVVQGGCPRGDGWGALNWTQRSEFSSVLTYKKGSVGLASAGKDSEGVQFFITHGFTPSLDGRYTIFGEITEGLEIIDLLQIGDIILRIERI